ncbi:hypothetical protein FF38_06218, partial [Lucilia cuprina]
MSVKFVGKDFLKMQAPPNYKAGISRGDFGFSTTADKSHKSEEFNAQELKLVQNIDLKRRKPRVSNDKKSNENIEPDPKSSLSQISIEDWARIPESNDQTNRHKRLKMEDVQTRRSYENFVNQDLVNADSLRPKLKLMIANQPYNYQ